MGRFNKLQNAIRGRSDKVERTVDKAVDRLDERTKGKHTDKLTQGAAKVKEAARRLDTQRDASDEPADRTGTGTAADDEEPSSRHINPAPLDISLHDLQQSLPGASGGPHTPPSESQAPVPPG